MEDERTIKLVTPEHSYEFVELNAINGLGIFHEWLRYAGEHAAEIRKSIEAMTSSKDFELSLLDLFKSLCSDDEGFTKLRELAIKHIDMKKLFELCMEFLGNAIVDGEKCDEFGMCSVFRGRPDEAYTALVLAIACNFKDYFPFVKRRLDTKVSPSQGQRSDLSRYSQTTPR
jgi:hypothetical protein